MNAKTTDLSMAAFRRSVKSVLPHRDQVRNLLNVMRRDGLYPDAVEPMEEVHLALDQLLAGRGLSPDTAFERIGASAFRRMVRLLGWKTCRQDLLQMDETTILDAMTISDESGFFEVVLYNRVPRPSRSRRTRRAR